MEDIESKGNWSEFVLPLVRTIAVSFYNDDLTSRSTQAEDMPVEDECVEDIESKGNWSEFVLPLVRTIAASFIFIPLAAFSFFGQGNKAPFKLWFPVHWEPKSANLLNGSY